jgi:hypothetical protein
MTTYPTTEAVTTSEYLFGSPDRSAPRRLRGLRMPVIPTGSWLAQVGGGVAALVGTYLQFGLAVTLIAGGLAAVVLGTLREAGKI